MIILFVYIILMKLTINQTIIIFIAILIIAYSSFYKGKREKFSESGLDNYLKNTGGMLCDESLDNTEHDNNMCSRLAKTKDVRKLWHYFYDKPQTLAGISGIWKRNYKHGRAKGLKMFPYTDFPGNNISYHRVWKEECKKIGENTPGSAGVVTGNNEPHCWIKEKMVNQRRNWGRYAWMKGHGHQFTISFWFRINKVNGNWRQILRIGHKEFTSRCPAILIYPNGTAVHTRVSTDSSWNEGLDTRNGDISLNRWTHYAVTLNNKKLKIYIDGYILKESTLNGNPTFSNNMTIWGGNSSNRYSPSNWRYSNNDIDLSKVKVFKFSVNDHYIKDVLAVKWFKEPVPFRLAQRKGNMGRLEYKYKGKWGTVCDDYFDQNDQASQVACRSMGFSGGKMVRNWATRRKFWKGRGGPTWGRPAGNGLVRIVMDDVQCKGGENSLLDCKFLPKAQHNCSHGEDVILECTN
jgi:hypothetical protein